MARLSIKPRTKGLLTVLIEQEVAGVLVGVTSATVRADVFDPRGIRAATAVLLVHSGSGNYVLDVSTSWSLDVRGRIVQGKFAAVISATIGTELYTDRVEFDVEF